MYVPVLVTEYCVAVPLAGAARAKGDVLTFLDAHCECSQGWLEPLLYELYHDRSVLSLTPCIINLGLNRHVLIPYKTSRPEYL